MEKVFDYCEINVKLLSLGDDFSIGGFKSMWFVFIAEADGPNGKYIAGKTSDQPIANVPGALFMPQEKELGHQNALETLLGTLLDDGWELLPRNKGRQWWNRRLRREPKQKEPRLAFRGFSFKRK